MSEVDQHLLERNQHFLSSEIPNMFRPGNVRTLLQGI